MNAFTVVLLGLTLFFMGATFILMALVIEYGKLLKNREPLDPITFEEDAEDE